MICTLLKAEQVFPLVGEKNKSDVTLFTNILDVIVVTYWTCHLLCFVEFCDAYPFSESLKRLKVYFESDFPTLSSIIFNK